VREAEFNFLVSGAKEPEFVSGLTNASHSAIFNSIIINLHIVTDASGVVAWVYVHKKVA
jgi:hypothetical protein